MLSNPKQNDDHLLHRLKLKKLTAENIKQLDEILASLDGSGEVRLILQHGELRFINKVEIHPTDDNDDAERMSHDK